MWGAGDMKQWRQDKMVLGPRTREKRAWRVSGERFVVTPAPGPRVDFCRALLEQIDDSVMVGHVERDRDGEVQDFVYVDVNAAALRSLGLRRDWVVGRMHSQVFPLADARWGDKMAEVAETGKPQVLRGWYPMATGWRFYEYRCYRVAADHVAIVAVDETEAEQSRQRILHSEQRLRLALDGARQGIWDHDVEPGLLAFDSRSKEILGWPPDATVTEDGFMQAIHPDDRPSWREAYGAAMVERGALEHELRVVRADGVERWIVMRGRAQLDACGNVDRMSGTMVDVTECRRSQEELRAYADRLRSVVEVAQRTEMQLRNSERMFRSLAQNIPSILMRFDSCQRIVYLSPSGERLVGQPWARVMGKTARQLGMPEALCDTFEPILSEVFRSGRPNSLSFERSTDLGLRTFDLRLSLEPCEGVESQTVLGIATDITDMKRAQADLAAANVSLAEADRRKNEFLAILSHELRNPLAPIKNSLFVLGRAPAGGEQARRALRIIERQTEQLSRLVDDLLDVTRIARNKIELQRELLELNELVRRAAEDYGWLFERAAVRLNVTLAPEPLYVNADGTRLAQVVGNLLQNAAKFGARDTQASLSVARDGQQAVVRVIDEGIGMAPATIECLFQPFMQAEASLDRSRGGLGLGLALVRGLVELHGGEVQAFSAGVGRGTEMVVRLPLGEGHAVTPPGMPAATVPRRRVLVIEDNRDAAESLREALQFGGHEVSLAHSGPEGIASVRELRPDVVLCDIGLPGMDGYEVARAIRADQALRGVRLVALTGYALAEDVRRAEAAGFEWHIPKPPSLERLDEVLSAAATLG